MIASSVRNRIEGFGRAPLVALPDGAHRALDVTEMGAVKDSEPVVRSLLIGCSCAPAALRAGVAWEG